MDFIEMRTLTFILFIESLFLGLIFLYFSHIKKNYPGTREFSFSLLCVAASMILFSLQNMMGPFITSVAGSTLNISGVFLTPYAFRKFFGKDGNIKYYASLTALSFFFFYIFTIIFAGMMKGRNIWICIVCAMAFYETFHLLYFNRLDYLRSITRAASAIYFIMASIYIVRLFMMAFGGPIAINIISAVGAEKAILIINIVFGMITTVSAFIFFVRMVNFRLENDITESESKLRQYASELERSDAAKNKFLSIISHDLRNPVDGMASLLRAMVEEGKIPESAGAEIDKLKRTADGMASLLVNLLDWARAQTGSVANSPETISVPEIVFETVKILEMRARNKNISVKFEGLDNKFVFADRRMFSTILRNLLSNAIKFSKRDGGIIISAISAGSSLKVTVKDTGIGINERKLKNLFGLDRSAFYSEGTEGEPGTGLGLLICRDFVALNGGSIEINSVKNDGTAVTVTLRSMEAA